MNLQPVPPSGAHGAVDAVLLGCALFTDEPPPKAMPSPALPSPAVTAPDAARSERDARLAALVAQSARGNTSAFEAFYDDTAGYARGLARRVLRSDDDADDLLADVYFEAWRTAARYDATRGSALTWLLTIVRSRALDMLRQRSTHPSAAGSECADRDLPDDAHEDPGERLWQAQAGSRLHAALLLLSSAERWVVGLAYFRELTHAEIAARTNMPLGTVKSHIARAQGKLRAALAGESQIPPARSA